MLSSALKLWISLALLLIAILIVSVLLGSASPLELWQMWQRGDSAAAAILWQLRLPRALAAIFCGALLALAGCLMQVQLRNPLADPYILGVSGGAAVGGLLALLLAGEIWLAVGAGAGAIASLLLLLLLGLRMQRLDALSSPLSAGGNLVRLILLGAMLSAVFGAAVSLLLTLAPQAALRGILFWLMGDLSGAQVPPLFWLIALTLACGALWLARDLNLLCRGEEYAFSLGVMVVRRRWQVILLASLATACAVSIGGAIGFVGLVVPHALRGAIGNDQRILLPAAMLCGGAFLLLCDTLARSAMAPLQLPVGVVTALIGAPLFIWLLVRHETERAVRRSAPC